MSSQLDLLPVADVNADIFASYWVISLRRRTLRMILNDGAP